MSTAVRLGATPVAVTENGTPRILRASRSMPAAAGVSAEEAARAHLAYFAPAYGVNASVASTARQNGILENPGFTIVALQQRADGVEVYGGEVKVMMDASLGLVALSGTPRNVVAPAQFDLAPSEALAGALSDLYRTDIDASQVVSSQQATMRQDYTWFDGFKQGSVTLQEGRAKQVLYSLDEAVVPAYFVEFYAQNQPGPDADAFRYFINARDGRVLKKINLTADDSFDYRVWATGLDNRPNDGPHEDFTPHPTGVPDGSYPPYIPSALVTMDGFNRPRDPWLVADPSGTTETLGNNVDAYIDLDNIDGLSPGDFRATSTGGNTFDYTYDVNLGPLVNTTQQNASIVQLFYDINWLHDYWYDSGFTEATRNAQMSNYGRGGMEGDPIKSEAQDSALRTPTPFRNNANMSTPADGFKPRMQMFLWTNDISEVGWGADPGNLDNFPFPLGAAQFGPPFLPPPGPQQVDVTAPASLVTPNIGCTAIAEDLTGKIAVIDRGSCGFELKTINARARGAVGVIIVNNAGGTTVAGMLGDPTLPDPDIMALMISQNNGATLKAAIAAGPITLHMKRLRGPELDGSLDGTVVAHEWGHYFHHRLQDCTSYQCRALSEGTGDFSALHLIAKDGDDLGGAFALAIYDTFRNSFDAAYFGIRRGPYSTDFTKNALTFQHVSTSATLPITHLPGGNNAEVHNAGEIWTTTMWEAYVALQMRGGRSFEEARRAMANYLVAGFFVSPIDATYTETRDSILLVAETVDRNDQAVMAQAFARRGMGSCAVAALPADTSLEGIVESFEVKGNILLSNIEITDNVASCDSDGFLDSGETGTLSFDVSNSGGASLSGAAVTLATTASGVIFPRGSTINLSSLAPHATRHISVPVVLDLDRVTADVMDLDVTVAEASACQPQVVGSLSVRINVDDIPAASATDDVESPSPVWAPEGTVATVWNREAITSISHQWRGIDFGAPSDTSLVSPLVQVGTGAFTVTFEHRYAFEADTTRAFDGGVIEFSTDDGATWADVSTLGISPGYNATLFVGSGNPIEGRAAFGRTNPATPGYDTVTLAFGTQLAGQNVRLRFRIGTDASAGAPGWEIDDLAFQGIVGTPFPILDDDVATCQVPPAVSAGPDQTVASGAAVTLAGSASDPNGDPITIRWTQIGGPGQVLSGVDSESATFTAALFPVDTVLTFKLAAVDAFFLVEDTVDITVQAAVLPDEPPMDGGTDAGPDGGTDAGPDGGADAGPDGGADSGTPDGGTPPDDGDGCGCRAGGNTPANVGLLLPFALAFLLRRRRRFVCPDAPAGASPRKSKGA